MFAYSPVDAAAIPALRERYMPDGLHPNDAGYEKLSCIVENFLHTHYHK